MTEQEVGITAGAVGTWSVPEDVVEEEETEDEN